MAEANPRWIDAPEFRWTPERPFRAEPHFTPPIDPSFVPLSETTPANDDDAAIAEPAPIRKPRTPAYPLARLVIGLAQGVGLLFFFAANNSLTSASGMVLLFAPLLLLASLSNMPGKLLLPWVLIASLGAGLLGSLQPHGATDPTIIVLAGLFLFIGQAMVMAWSRGGASGYAAYHDSAWLLGAQLLLCGLAAFGCILAVKYGFAALRLTYPTARAVFVTALLAPICIALMSWLASGQRLRLPLKLLQTGLSLALPALALLGFGTGVAGFLLHWQPPLEFCLAQAFALLLCLNASYGDGSPRPRWREIAEALGAFALAPPVWLAWTAVKPALDWNSSHILMTATLGFLALYAFFYVAAALIGLGGGGVLKRIERANLGLAFLALGVLATFACR